MGGRRRRRRRRCCCIRRSRRTGQRTPVRLFMGRPRQAARSTGPSPPRFIRPYSRWSSPQGIPRNGDTHGAGGAGQGRAGQGRACPTCPARHVPCWLGGEKAGGRNWPLGRNFASCLRAWECRGDPGHPLTLESAVSFHHDVPCAGGAGQTGDMHASSRTLEARWCEQASSRPPEGGSQALAGRSHRL